MPVAGCRKQKSIERNLVFANVGVDVQCNFSACGRQLGKRWDGDGYVVADPHRVDDYLIGMARDELSAKMGNHGGIVLRRVLWMSESRPLQYQEQADQLWLWEIDGDRFFR